MTRNEHLRPASRSRESSVKIDSLSLEALAVKNQFAAQAQAIADSVL